MSKDKKEYYVLSIPYDSAYGIYNTFQQALEEGNRPENEWLKLILYKTKMNRALKSEDLIGRFRDGKYISSEE
ncbi:hypothetical protein C7R57_03445 [Macrococcoides caseolyticum subsp. caseolyticum]|uniref:hypothetical protein n=1 Tax=Macrococcoides caseolyticum TaxID=69966 RepID=UPI000CD09B92|nr:hypothetical protein [Macrococcus caseolyticus]PNZ72079.1 hypothetical protein CD152_08290 [Macrococcus caseolyticus]QPT45681.1 hypothetical protein I6G25_05435 [Macrococcus caseolyticus]RAK47588.1 hypothetical protein C7R57_03445 [Macrococcus caseolyticus subsp. caseolyticus]HCD19424.1 hypothetical protein [Macrococcus caseolyticus]